MVPRVLGIREKVIRRLGFSFGFLLNARRQRQSEEEEEKEKTPGSGGGGALFELAKGRRRPLVEEEPLEGGCSDRGHLRWDSPPTPK